MKSKDYMKAIVDKVDDQNRITCQDCGKKDTIGHAIVDHYSGSVKVVCDSCFVTKYKSGLYGEIYKA